MGVPLPVGDSDRPCHNGENGTLLLASTAATDTNLGM